VLRDRPGAEERALEIDRQHPVPLGIIHADHETIFGDASVVDEYIDSP
jgi:hypothetical protein